MENTKGWIVAIGILLIFALAAGLLVWIVQDTIQRTVAPVQDTAGNIGTRVAFVLNPTPTILPDPVTIVRQIKGLSRLETIQYTVEKVITAETGQEMLGFLFGDRLILVAHGDVIAGVDLAKIGPEDITIENGVLMVDLPEPEIFISTLDNEKSYVYDRETGLLSRGDVNLETAARQAAEREIEQAALDGGVLDLARQNAETYLERLFRSLGYAEVVFSASDETVPTASPQAPQGTSLP